MDAVCGLRRGRASPTSGAARGAVRYRRTATTVSGSRRRRAGSFGNIWNGNQSECTKQQPVMHDTKRRCVITYKWISSETSPEEEHTENTTIGKKERSPRQPREAVVGDRKYKRARTYKHEGSESHHHRKSDPKEREHREGTYRQESDGSEKSVELH